MANGTNIINIEIPEVFEPLYKTELHRIILESGRIGGKTINAILLCVLDMVANPYSDYIIGRANYGSLRDSSYQEVLSSLETIGLKDMFKVLKSPLRVSKADGSGTIYFIGVDGNEERTKGIKTQHKLRIFILEEVQEIKTRENLEQAEASIRRRIGLNENEYKLIYIFNPPAQKFRWINVWHNLKKSDPDYLCIHSSWRDISQFLNNEDISSIVKDSILDPEHYKWFYDGIPSGGFGSIYPMFDERLIAKNKEELRLKTNSSNRIVAVIIGGDGAVNTDCTAFVPLFILENGQAICTQMFIHNPKNKGVMGSFNLVEKYVTIWFNLLIKNNMLDSNSFGQVPILFSIDSAATDLIQACKYFFSNRATVSAVSKGTIPQMIDRVQSTLAKNLIIVYDDGEYFATDKISYYKKEQEWNSTNPLALQLTNLVWNEQQTGYDKIIPNDVSDAFTYAILKWFSQTENLMWLRQVQAIRKDYYNIK